MNFTTTNKIMYLDQCSPTAANIIRCIDAGKLDSGQIRLTAPEPTGPPYVNITEQEIARNDGLPM